MSDAWWQERKVCCYKCKTHMHYIAGEDMQEYVFWCPQCGTLRLGKNDPTWYIPGPNMPRAE